jgi:ATP-dependent Clp protease adaptor protein ClpS
MTTDTITKVENQTKPVVEVKPPHMYNVVYVNDSVTTMEFVVDTLMGIFGHGYEAAEQLTMEIHEQGSAIVATLPYEIAEQKSVEVVTLARKCKFPLQVRVEPE